MNLFDLKETLHNGLDIPVYGLDTIGLKDAGAYTTIRNALDNNCRHIEADSKYGIENEIALALQDANKPRSSLFLTYEVHAQKNQELTKRIAKSGLKKMQCDYFDCLLLSWNHELKNEEDSSIYADWKALEQLYKEGLAKSIGIVDFRPWQVEYLLQDVEIAPMVSLTGLYPGHPDIDVLKSNNTHLIQTMVYLPSDIDSVLNCSEIRILADKYHTSGERVIFRYLRQKNCLLIMRNLIDGSSEIPFVFSDQEMKFLDVMKDYAIGKR